MIYPDRAALLADAGVLAADRRFDGVTGLLFPAGDQVVHALFCTRGFSDVAPDNATLLGGLGFIPGTEQSGDLPYFDSANAVPPLAFTAVIFDLNREQGGTHYPFTALALSRAEWERHYGPAFGGLADAKRRFDPHNVFASGPDIF